MGGGILISVLNSARKFLPKKAGEIIIDFLSVTLNFLIYFLLDIKLENGNKRLYALTAFLIGTTAVIYIGKLLIKKIKNKRGKNV